MAQTIKHRRGKLEYIAGITPINGELIIASSSDLSVHQWGFTVCWGWRKRINSSNKILTCSADIDVIGGSFDTQSMVFRTMIPMTRNWLFLVKVVT